MNEVILVKRRMQHSYFQNEFVLKFYSIATIQPGSPIVFLVNYFEKLYLTKTTSVL